jgi:hypothetical protein
MVRTVLPVLFLVLGLSPQDSSAATYSATPSNYASQLSHLLPGDTLVLAAGTYPLLPITNLQGTPTAWITITGPTSGTPATIVGSSCCNTVQISNSSYVAIENLTINSQSIVGVFGVAANDALPNVTHDILIQGNTFIGQDGSQQTVAISTKTPTWNWIIRNNTITGAGTGLYLGNSDGSDPFVAGLIEHNLVRNTIGYDMEIKHQPSRPVVPGMPTGFSETVIRNNVFIKNDQPSPDGDRPNVLLGGFPSSGAGSTDMYDVYGNFFYHNPREALLQAEGRLSVHDNVFVDGQYTAAVFRYQNLPLQIAHVYHNTVYSTNQGFYFGTAATVSEAVFGNLIFAGSPLAGTFTNAANNITDALANAVNYVTAPSFTLGSMNFYPKAGTSTGPAVDLSPYASEPDSDIDFNGVAKEAAKQSVVYRGAYAGEGVNPGWQPQSAIKTNPPASLNAQLSGLTCTPAALVSGQTATCSLTLGSASLAPSTVLIYSSTPSLTGPTGVVLPAGSTSASFQVQAATVTSGLNAGISAILNGSSLAAGFSVNPIPAVQSLVCSPTTAPANSAIDCVVTLKNPPIVATAIALSSGNSIVSVPAQVTVAAGTTSIAFTATSANTSTSQSSLLTATLNGVSATETLTVSPSGSPWYTTGGTWTSREPIAIDHTRVAGGAALTNFPVLISLTDANLAANAKADGSDILFTAADGATKLSHQIEQYTPATGKLIAWVNIPSLSATSDTVLYMYYGNPSAPVQQNPAAVWTGGYVAVWHMPNGATLSAADSTAGGYNGTVNGVTAAAGMFGGAANNASANHSIALTGLNPGAAVTVEAWINPTGTSGNGYGAIASHNSFYGLYYLNGTSKLDWYSNGDHASTGTLTKGAWNHIVVTSDSSRNFAIYINGVLDSSGQAATAMNTQFAYLFSDDSGEFLTGMLDELRISNSVRSAGWVATEYANQNAPASFATLGPQQTQGAGVPVTVTVTSAPVGMSLSVDSVACTAPCSFQWAPGSSHTVAAATQSGGAGTQYAFSSWSDGGAASHTIAPSASGTYTASFNTQYFLTTSINPSSSGTIGPAGGWFNAGAIVPVSATANSGYQFSGFSGALTGTSTPQNLTMSSAMAVTANFTSGPAGITVTSAPAGLSLIVDSVACTAPCSFQWVPGSVHTIAASSQSGGVGTQYVFALWSDGGAMSHTVTAPSGAATYTASFGTQFLLTATASTGGAISPSSAWFNAGAVVGINASANSGYQFAGFSGALSGTATPQNLTMSAPATVSATFTSGGSSSTAWYSTGGTWSNRKSITIDHTRVSGGSALTNFPVLVSITDASVQAVAKADGSDIVFTAADGLTKLNHQIEQYNSATGQLTAWVSVPSVSPVANTALYMYYGNAAASSQQNAAAVWDANYVGVWHLPNGSALSAADSTAGVNNGSINGVTAAPGKIGGGANNASANHSIVFAGPNPGTAVTVELWVNPTGTSSNGYGALISHNNYNGLYFRNSTGKLDWYANGDYQSVGTLTKGAWNHVAITADSSNHYAIYINGALDSTGTTKAAMNNQLGYFFSDTSGEFLTGALDEVRISNSVRTAGWVATGFNNQNAPSTFLSLGAQELHP